MERRIVTHQPQRVATGKHVGMALGVMVVSGLASLAFPLTVLFLPIAIAAGVGVLVWWAICGVRLLRRHRRRVDAASSEAG